MKFGKKKNYDGETQYLDVPLAKPTFLVIAAIVLILAAMIGLNAGCKAYNRYQARQDADNAVHIAAINAQKEHNNIAVAKQHAKQAVAEARGIRKSQEIINATLTPLYLQHEAIKAQERMANSPNHTQIYIPSGSNGIPLINDLGAGGSAQAAAK